MTAFLALMLAACQPAPDELPEATRCPEEPQPEGGWFVGTSPCSSVLLGEGEARRLSDIYIANSRFRGFVRAPQHALTQLGVGGGTLIDFSAWGYRDRMHEVVPLVDDGWLDVDRFEVAGNQVFVGGTVASLPDRAASAVGARREVAWRIEPDDPWLYIDGADGLYIHAAGPLEPLLDGHLVGTVVYGHDGGTVQDLGGALRIEGAGALTTAEPDEALRLLFPDRAALTGTAEGADQLVLLSGSEVAWRVPLPEDGGFELEVPPDVDGVRAEAAGFSPSPRQGVSEGMTLTLGAAGSLEVVVKPDVPATLTWIDDQGRESVEPTGPGLRELPVGAGTYHLTVDAGPAYEPWSGEVVVEGPATLVEVGVTPRFDPGSHVLVRPSVPGDRSRDWRGTDSRALWDAFATGATFTVLAPTHDAPNGPPSVDAIERGDAVPVAPEGMLWRPGTTLPTPWGQLLVWPYTANRQHNAHGAPPPRQDAHSTLSAALRGNGRNAAVDLDFLAALVGSPRSLWPRPSLVWLEHPLGDPSAAWAAWWPWLDAGISVAPLASATWARVPPEGPLSAADVEQALLRGRLSAGSGPLIELSWGGAQAGDVTTVDAELEIRIAGCCQLDRYAVLGEGGEVLVEADLDQTPWSGTLSVQPGRWVVVTAWSTSGGDWAVTGPLWLQGPAP